MAQIGQPSQQSVAIQKVVEAQRETLLKMLHPALLNQGSRLVEFALAAARNPAIAACTPESIIESLYTSAKVGLMPDGVEGAIVPRKEKGVAKAKFEPMYQGLVKAYLRGGKVKRVHADAILRGEKYEITSGTTPDIKHWPDIERDRQAWDDIVATYAVAFFDSGPPVFIICAKPELDRLRANAPEGGPWNNHPAAMAWKTPLKRLRKLVPLEPELQSELQRQEAEEGVINIEGEVLPPTTLEGVLGIDKQPESPPEVWLSEIRIEQPPYDRWCKDLTGSKNPKLGGLTWEQIAASDDKEVVAACDALLETARETQRDKGSTPVPFQRLAVTCAERIKRLQAQALQKEAEQTF